MKNVLVSAGVALLVVVLGLVYFGPTKIIEKIGAIPGAEVSGPCWTVGGVKECSASMVFNTATSTLCTLPTPSATSSLVSFTAQINSSTSTIMNLVLENTLNAFAPVVGAATSTNVIMSPLYAANTASGTAIIFQATSSAALSTSRTDILRPNSYLAFYARSGTIVDQKGGAVGSSVFPGTDGNTANPGVCKAVMREVNTGQ